MCCRVTVAEVENLNPTALDPERIDTPGVFVQHVVRAEDPTKHIEQRTVRAREGA